MIIRVQYFNDVYDLISDIVLQRLIEDSRIRRFYRHSEKRWAIIGMDPVRSKVPSPYAGPEKRLTYPFGEPV
ncbi:MAG TPA: hypothetical protein VK452_11560 [Dissulfurispiraceae bacterium]|nr:hypothetical protein [Dissulfurispiraceae bacterium]